jgi:hypothetical protein
MRTLPNVVEKTNQHLKCYPHLNEPSTNYLVTVLENAFISIHPSVPVDEDGASSAELSKWKKTFDQFSTSDSIGGERYMHGRLSLEISFNMGKNLLTTCPL